MGNVNPGLPVPLAKFLVTELELQVGVESGTYMGAGAISLSQLCQEVWTIEAAPSLYEQASKRLSALGNVRAIFGSSAAVMPSILREINQPALFWLDGHWSGGPTAGDTYECPVLDEIRAIDEWKHRASSCILIDDARLFFGPPPPPHDLGQWPTFTEISDALRHGSDRYVTALDDVIIAVPASQKGVVDAYWLPIAARNSELMEARNRRGIVARAIRKLEATVRPAFGR